MAEFKQLKDRERFPDHEGTIVVACPPMKNNDNISMIARTASCMGASELIITGQNKVNPHISRDCSIPIKHHNSILPVIRRYKFHGGYCAIGIEQATNSCNIYNYEFPNAPTILIIGNECKGIDQELLNELDEVIEVPLYGQPHSLNVAVAASICLYEYAKQFSRI